MPGALNVKRGSQAGSPAQHGVRHSAESSVHSSPPPNPGTRSSRLRNETGKEPQNGSLQASAEAGVPSKVSVASRVNETRDSGDSADNPGMPRHHAATALGFVQARFDSFARYTSAVLRLDFPTEKKPKLKDEGAQEQVLPDPSRAPGVISSQSEVLPSISLNKGTASPGAGRRVGISQLNMLEEAGPSIGVVHVDSSGSTVAPIGPLPHKRRKGNKKRRHSHSDRGREVVDQAAFERALRAKELVRGIGHILGSFHRLGLPETSWKNKMPYREPRVPLLARGLKWPEEQHFSSEEQKRKFIRESRKLQPFMFREIPSWSWIAADIGLIAFLTWNPRWPWSLN